MDKGGGHQSGGRSAALGRVALDGSGGGDGDLALGLEAS